MKRFPSQCPVCSSGMKIKTLECSSCQTSVNGDFEVQQLLALSPEELDFLMLFLKTRGNLSEMAKIVGVSYPTVRVRFEEFLKKVGIEPEKSRDKALEILDLLDKGEISADEAVKRIRQNN